MSQCVACRDSHRNETCPARECGTSRTAGGECVAVRCSVLQCVVECVAVFVVCCSVLQCDSCRDTRKNEPCPARQSATSRTAGGECVAVLRFITVCCSALLCVAVRCCVAVCCNVLQCDAVCCSVLQRVALCYNTLLQEETELRAPE